MFTSRVVGSFKVFAAYDETDREIHFFKHDIYSIFLCYLKSILPLAPRGCLSSKHMFETR